MHGSEKPRFFSFQNRAYDLSTRLCGREQTNGARGSHYRTILKFRSFSLHRKVDVLGFLCCMKPAHRPAAQNE